MWCSFRDNTDIKGSEQMLYQISNGTVSAGGQTILSHVDFYIKGKEKIAIVGKNGAGKTTLLRLIAGELDLDRDDKRNSPGITRSRDISIGFFHQNISFDMTKTVDEIMMEGFGEEELFSRDAFSYRARFDKLLTGFGFDKNIKKKELSNFSGGEQTKIALINLLLKKPDLLLLDEPTNHLDIKTVEWLEEYLNDYEGAVIIVSHDRFFLDNVVDAVYELENHTLTRYAGSYTQFRMQKQKDYDVKMKAYLRQQAELARLQELIEKFRHKPNKASFARSRKSIIERTERIDKPSEDNVHIFTGEIDPLVPGSKWVFEAEHLKIGYDEALFEISLRLKRGQKIGIIGDNGVGKTTFLKVVAGLEEPIDGRFSLGNNTCMGYFDQHSANISSAKSVVEHFHELFPAMAEKDVRKTLGEYLFSGEAAAKKIDDLSGGEKARLILCELLTSRPNFMVLDEPTNHMDIQAKETLESAFRAYKGSMLFVSHDRYFVSRVADAIIVIEQNKAYYYPFGYAHYIERKKKGDGNSIAAMVEAENQAMVAGLHAVPEPERHRLREIGTQEAYIDWQLRLADEPLDEARDYVAMIWESYESIKSEAEYESWKKALGSASDIWTDECLKWYDNYLLLFE